MGKLDMEIDLKLLTSQCEMLEADLGHKLRIQEWRNWYWSVLSTVVGQERRDMALTMTNLENAYRAHREEI